MLYLRFNSGLWRMAARLALVDASQGRICVNMGAAGSQSSVIGFAWLVSGQRHRSIHKGHLLAKLPGTQRQSPFLIRVVIHWKSLLNYWNAERHFVRTRRLHNEPKALCLSACAALSRPALKSTASGGRLLRKSL